MKQSRRREEPENRKKEILEAAMFLAVAVGYQKITREQVALKAKTSCALVTWYFKTMDNLRNEVMQEAIRRENFLIIAQGLSLGDEQAHNISPDLKTKVLDFLKDPYHQQEISLLNK